MINEIKKSFQLIRYGYGMKMNLIGGILILVIGILLLWTGNQGTALGAILFVFLGPMMCVQTSCTLLCSGMVTASPRKREIEILLSDIISAVSALVGYLTIEIYTLYAKELFWDRFENMVMLCMCVAVSTIYFGFAYKYYLVSSILYAVLVFASYIFGIVFFELTEIEINFAVGSVVGFVIVVIGVVLSSVVKRLAYKKTVSVWACGASLRKAMQ